MRLGEGKFPFGLALSGAIILAAARGTPVACVGIKSYKFQMGVAAHPDSGIREFKDLEGKTVSACSNSGESPFRKVLAERAGFDLSKVNINNVDISILEQSVMQKQVDAVFCIGLSSLPPMLAAGFKPKFLPAEQFKVDLYGVSLITQQRMVETNPDLCQRFVEGALEGVAYTMSNPDECIDIFMREVPEVALSKSGKQFVKSGMEIWINSLLAAEPKAQGMGWSDEKAVANSIDLVMKYVAPEGAARPDAAKLFTNKFAGSIKPTASQWEAAAKWSRTDRQQNTRRQLNWTAGAARTPLRRAWTQRPSPGRGGAAASLRTLAGCLSKRREAVFSPVGIRMRKIRRKVEQIAGLQKMSRSADGQFQLAFDDKADFLALVLKGAVGMSTGLDHDQKALEQAAGR